MQQSATLGSLGRKSPSTRLAELNDMLGSYLYALCRAVRLVFAR